MNLIQRAALQPGGETSSWPIQKLNQYFDGTSPTEYQLDSAAREYLMTQMPPERSWRSGRPELDATATRDTSKTA